MRQNMDEEKKEIATVRDLSLLYTNAHLSKTRHFEAARRTQRTNKLIVSGNVLINIVLGSMLFSLLVFELPVFAKWIGAVLSLGAVLCGFLQLSSNLIKLFDGHRSLGNRYLSFARKCEYVLGQHYDNLIKLMELSSQIPKLHEIYNQINIDAETFPTSRRDYKKAKQQERHRQSKLGQRAIITKDDYKDGG